MGINLTMRRLTARDSAQALADGRLGPDFIEHFEEISKDWGVLTHIFANGIRNGDLPLAAQSITGGVVLENEEPDFGGTRVIPPADVRSIHEALTQIDDVEIVRRHEVLDFAGIYGGRKDGRSAKEVDDVLDQAHELRDFYSRAVGDGSAVAIWYE